MRCTAAADAGMLSAAGDSVFFTLKLYLCLSRDVWIYIEIGIKYMDFHQMTLYIAGTIKV